ncbi:WhiB family transcriptional regulator [Kineococcus sp. T90]|nr:WhiB family transcriptional regulator [Kineococcus indalonis]NAZ87646.1 WhiB family transcriptional regulator [Kineococcus indalonis]
MVPAPGGVPAPRTAPAAAPVPCRTAPADLFFADEQDLVQRAKELCAACPLLAACLAGALERREPAGVWGGQLFVDGVPVAYKRGRGRPRKDAPPVAVVL